MVQFSKNKILIIVGELSGDLYGSSLIREVKSRNPQSQFFGIGGSMMANEGMDILVSAEKMAILGFIEVIRHLPFIQKVFSTIINEIEERKPALVVLIDYPGFNIRLAHKIKKRWGDQIKILYYISPQVWAWKKNRVYTIAENVDAMAVVFPFEVGLYENLGLNVQFVGHPLLDVVKPERTKEEFCAEHKLDPQNKIIGLLPGSRKQEIKRHLSLMTETVKRLQSDVLGLQAVIAKPPEIDVRLYERHKDTNNITLTESAYDVMYHSDFLLTASGTATLESGMAGTPMAVIYKMSALTFQIAKRVVKLPYVGLINIVHDMKVVPEFIQADATPEKLAAAVKQYLQNDILYENTSNRLRTTETLLGNKGAAGRVAQMLLDLIS